MSDSTALALVPKGQSEAMQLATELAKSRLLPEHFRGQVADVFMALALGLELGLPPVTALQSIYSVHGRPGLYADAMVALILASGLAEYFVPIEISATAATWETKRKGAPMPSRTTVTMEQAVTAGWPAQNKKYATEPDVMLSARAKGRLAKQVYPDVLRGIASVEEIRDDAAALVGFISPPPVMTTGTIIDAVSEESPAVDAKDLASRILETKSLDELAKLAPEIKRIPEGAASKELRAMYQSHGKRLRPTPKSEDAA